MNVSAKMKKPLRIRDYIPKETGKESLGMILVPLP